MYLFFFYINNIYLAHLAVYGQQGVVRADTPRPSLGPHAFRTRPGHRFMFIFKGFGACPFIVITISCEAMFRDAVAQLSGYINLKGGPMKYMYVYVYSEYAKYNTIQCSFWGPHITMAIHSKVQAAK